MEEVRTELLNCPSGKETITKLWKLEKAKQMKVIVFLWRWWSARNKANDGKKMQSAIEIQGSVSYFVMEFEKLQTTKKGVSDNVRHTWKPPPLEYYKINTDGAFDPNTRTGGWGFVVRNTNGEVLLAGAGNICHVASALHAETIAALKGVQQVARLGMQHIILETDASILASAINATGIDRSPIGCLVYQIRDLMQSDFSTCSVSVCNRNCNKVADCLAGYGATVLNLGSEVLMSQVPVFVSELVSGDLPALKV
jgi:ribonuclease HI